MSYSDLSNLVTFRPLERPLQHGPVVISPFSASFSSTVALLARELRAHGAQTTVMEVDMREQDFRLDGMPRADRTARSPGIVLSFRAMRVPNHPDLRYEVATYHKWQDNVRAVALALESLRAVDRYGVTRRGEQYAGWKQLGSGTDLIARGRDLIREHGGVMEALKATHPDRGGTPDDFRAVEAARHGARA